MEINKKILTPEQRDRLDSFNMAQAQITALKDIADMTQELVNLQDERIKSGSEDNKNFGTLLVDIRESLAALKDKKQPEIPDYSKPVVDAMNKLEEALTTAVKGIDVKPVIDAPQVNVTTPDVDLKGVESAVKEIPKAFEKAIKLIPRVNVPETDFTPLLQAWEGISEQLVSIETATRLKPLPGNMKVTNPDGTAIGSLSGSTAYENRNDTTTDTNLVYLGKALPGSATSDAAWQIKRYNKSAGHMSFADDVTTFTKTWDDRTSYGY